MREATTSGGVSASHRSGGRQTWTCALAWAKASRALSHSGCWVPSKRGWEDGECHGPGLNQQHKHLNLTEEPVCPKQLQPWKDANMEKGNNTCIFLSDFAGFSAETSEKPEVMQGGGFRGMESIDRNSCRSSECGFLGGFCSIRSQSKGKAEVFRSAGKSAGKGLFESVLFIVETDRLLNELESCLPADCCQRTR